MSDPIENLKERGFQIIMAGDATSLDLSNLDLGSRFVVALRETHGLRQVVSRSIRLGRSIVDAGELAKRVGRDICVVCRNRKSTIVDWDHADEFETLPEGFGNAAVN